MLDEVKAFVVLSSCSVRLWRIDGDVKWLLIGLGGLVACATGIPAKIAWPNHLLRRL